MTKNKADLCGKIAALVRQHGNQWKQIADALNAAGVTTLKGQSWSDQNAKHFYDRNCEAASQQPTKLLPAVPHDLPEWLDNQAWEDFKAMLEWWRCRGEEPVRLPGHRPMFRGKRRNTGVHVHTEILRRAVEKAKQEKVLTGGSLSLLVEWLLWRYIGEPEDVLESVPAQEPSGSA